MFTNLITDRTLQDFQRWLYLRDKGWANMTDAEKAEWQTDLKGAYNYSDINRVSVVLNYLRDRLTESGYLGGNEFNLPTTWDSTHVMTDAAFKEYINAVGTVRNAMSHKRTTPDAPQYTGAIDYIEANNIELILPDIDELITNMRNARNYCGELFSGEIGG